jgi:hypothetical protein
MSLKYRRRSRFCWGRSFVLFSKSSFRLCYLSQELVEFDLFVEFLFLLVVFSHTVWMSRVYCVPLDLVSLSLCASLYHLVRLIHVSYLGWILKILNWNCSLAPLHMLLTVYYCNDNSFCGMESLQVLRRIGERTVCLVMLRTFCTTRAMRQQEYLWRDNFWTFSTRKDTHQQPLQNLNPLQ